MTRKYNITAISPLGGGGTRLYPVTIEVPKHLIPIADTPILNAAIKHYVSQGLRKIVLGVTGFDNRVQSLQVFGSGQKYKSRESDGDVEIHYTSYEDREYRNKGSADVFLWTLENYERMIGKDHVLLINGDNLSNTSLEDLYETHSQKNALLTIAVKGLDIDDPLLKGFGTVVFDDKSMRVTKFVEKSSNPASRYANTGICFFSHAIYEFIKDSKFFKLLEDRRNNGRLDVGGHFIPALVDAGADVYAYPLSGAWSDIGTPHSFRVTTNDILHDEYPHILFRDYDRVGDSLIHKSTRHMMGSRLSNVKLEGRCIVGSDVDIGEDTVIRDSVVGVNSRVGKNVTILGTTTLFPYSRVEDGSRLTNSIVGYNTTIGRRSTVGNGAVIGSDIYLPEATEIGVDWRIVNEEHRAMIEARDAKYKVVEELPDFKALRFVTA